MFQIFLHERLKLAEFKYKLLRISRGHFSVSLGCLFCDKLRFYFVYCEYFWSPKVMQRFLYLILCATSPAHFESRFQKLLKTQR